MTSDDYKAIARQLVRGIEELNQTQNAVLLAINNLSNKFNDSEFADPGSSLSLVPTPNAVVASSDQPAREHGIYVNWNHTHSVLLNQLWRKASVFTDYCGKRETGIAHDICGKAITPSLLNAHEYKTMNKHERFPKFGLYVNVSNPVVAAEILYISAIHYTKEECKNNNKKGELISRFLQTASIDMHTRSSFEEKYKLRWNDKNKQSFFD